MSLLPSAMVKLVMVNADHMILLLDPHEIPGAAPCMPSTFMQPLSRWNKHSSTVFVLVMLHKTHMDHGSIPSRPELLLTLLWSLALMEMALLLVHLFASNMQPPVTGHTTHEGNLDIPGLPGKNFVTLIFWRFLTPFPNR